MLNDVIDFFDVGYTDPENIADEVTRKYGMSPDEIIEEKERRIGIINDLEIISSVLTDNQRRILALTGAGFTVRQMGDMLDVSFEHISEYRRSIAKRLSKVADEERIQYLAGEVIRLAATSKGKHSKLYKELCEELDRRFSVREAMKRLFVTLTPRSSEKEADGGISMSSYPFEQAMAVETGMREGISDGRKVMKTIVKCRMPEYMAETFGDKCTCCTLCPTCKRKSDVEGRRGYGRRGLYKK